MKGCVTKSKRFLSLLLAVMVCATVLFSSTTPVKAADPEYDILLQETGTASANTEQPYTFTVSKNTTVSAVIQLPAMMKATVVLYDSAEQELARDVIASSQWYDYETYYGQVITYTNVPSGDYIIKMTLDQDSDYILSVLAEKILPTFNQTSVTVTAGFKTTLKIDNATGKAKWASSKTDVATVNSKGVVTAKKPGVTTIVAKVDGQKIYCKVKVKANKYTEKQYSASDFYYGSGTIQVYKAAYAANGDLVLKCRFVNNSGYTVNALSNLKITFQTAEGKTIGRYSVKTKKMNVAHGATKDFTVSIEKSKLKKTNADLRNAKYTTDGKYEYTTYTYR